MYSLSLKEGRLSRRPNLVAELVLLAPTATTTNNNTIINILN